MRPQCARRLSAAAGALLVAAVVAPLVWRHLVAAPPDQRLVDLAVYRAAGESVLLGRPVYGHLTPPPQLLPFTYPPVAALLAVPLALLPVGLLGWLWTVGKLALLTVAAGLAFRPLLDRAAAPWRPMALGALVAAFAWLLPMRDGIKFGQVDILLLALVAADLLPPRTRWPRGLLVGIAAAVKLTPAVFVVALWAQGRRRAARTAALSAAAITVAAALADPATSVAYWGEALFDTGRLGANDGTSNQSLRGLLLRSPLPEAVADLVWLASAAVVGYVGLRRVAAAGRAGDPLGAAALAGLLAVLLSPVAWIHHLTWVVLALAAIVRDGRDTRRVAAAAAVAAYLALPVPWWGVDLLQDGSAPRLVGRVVQDGFGLVALALLVTVPIGAPARSVTDAGWRGAQRRRPRRAPP